MNERAVPTASTRRLAAWRLLAVCAVGFLSAAFAERLSAQEPAPAQEQSSATGSQPEQPSPAPVVPPQIHKLEGQIQYVGPDTYILLDAQGRPQPLPGLTYEDLLKAWRATQASKPAEKGPRYTVELISMDGTAQSDRAELRFEATVQLLTDEPVDVPLGLIGAVLQGRPTIEAVEPKAESTTPAGTNENTTTQFVRFEPDDGGFVVKLVGSPGDRRRIVLNLLVPLVRDGAETSLALACTRALSSSLTLAVPGAVSDPNITDGAVVSQKTGDDGATRLTVNGAMGPFRLAWRAGDNSNGNGELATALNAVGSIRAAIDGRSVRTEARLTVSSYGASFDRFRVRLPAGGQLIHTTSSGTAVRSAQYRIVVETPDAKDAPPATAAKPNEPAGQIVRIELAEKQRGPVVIDLATEQPIAPQDVGNAVELNGFEVIGAIRQFGDLAIEVSNDWQARWKLGPNIRQIDPAELNATLQKPGLAAAFQYDREPWKLGITVAVRPSRIHVTPKYELDCTPVEARLKVTLAYQVFGSRAFEFPINLEGWELSGEPIESGGLVDQDRVGPPTDGKLVLPLSQASTKRAGIVIALRRDLPPDAAPVTLPLPVPVADSVGTGELIVRAAADVEIIPDISNSTGLAAMSASESGGTTSDAGGRELRFRTLLARAVLKADKLIRTREVDIAVSTDAEITRNGARIEQSFEYDVRHEPLSEFVFLAPPEFEAEAEDLNFYIATTADEVARTTEPPTPLMFTWSDDEGEESYYGSMREVHVILPQPKLGTFIVRAVYRVAAAANADRDDGWHLPLLQPDEGRVTSVEASLRSASTLAISLAAAADSSQSWNPAAATNPLSAAENSYRFVADRPESTLPILLSTVDVTRPTSTTIDRVWLQAWFTHDFCQERAAFRFRTTGNVAIVELPEPARSAEIEVLVDGQPAELLSRAAQITVQLARASDVAPGETAQEATHHTLELRYRRPLDMALVARHQLTPPQLVGAMALSEVYWQIVLPGDRNVVLSPSRMTPASQWQWLGNFWGQRPVKMQADLENWVSADTQLAPGDTQNEYLYTGLAPVATVELITAPRWLIVLTASALVLAAAILLMYAPLARRRIPLLIALACIIAGLAIAFPGPALLVAQASLLGIVGALAAFALTRLVSRPRTAPVILSTGSTHRHIGSRPESIVIPPVAASASTAPTATLRFPDSE